jgi:phosphatidyl-myo-inositol alpha-mannosyltransferase
MRIAQLTRMLPRADYAGGVSGQVDLLARALASKGHDVTVFALNPPAEPANYSFQRVQLPGHRPEAFGKLAPYLFPFAAAALPLDAFDVIHSHGDDHFVRARAPLVRTFHGWSWGEARNGARLRHRLYHFMMGFPELVSNRRAAAVVANSPSTKRYLRRDAEVIPCAYDAGRFFPDGGKSERPSILFVGDLDTRKRGRLLLQVFSETVRPAVPDAELWIVSADRPAMPGVRAMGRLRPADLARAYREAWVFCLPSSYEGFGVPYAEAMACGTPVVATANGGAEDVLAGGRYGVIAEDSDLGAALISLLMTPDRRAALTALGIERSCQYAIDRVATQYEAVYDSVVHAAAGARSAARRVAL